MSSLLLNYLLFLCIAGFVVLSILSIMAFADLPCMNIKQGKHINSGIILIVTAVIYAVLAVILFIKIRRSESNQKNTNEFNEVKNKKEYVRMNFEEDSAKNE